MSEPSDAQIIKTLRDDIAPYLGVRGMAHFANAALIAASRLEARGKISEATLTRAAIAGAIADGCGFTLDGERVLCNDPRAPAGIRQTQCGCLNIARAALEAALKGDTA